MGVQVWPKRCKCGRLVSLYEWRKLPFVIRAVDLTGSSPSNRFELRKCYCSGFLVADLDEPLLAELEWAIEHGTKPPPN